MNERSSIVIDNLDVDLCDLIVEVGPLLHDVSLAVDYREPWTSGTLPDAMLGVLFAGHRGEFSVSHALGGTLLPQRVRITCTPGAEFLVKGIEATVEPIPSLHIKYDEKGNKSQTLHFAGKIVRQWSVSA